MAVPLRERMPLLLFRKMTLRHALGSAQGFSCPSRQANGRVRSALLLGSLAVGCAFTYLFMRPRAAVDAIRQPEAHMRISETWPHTFSRVRCHPDTSDAFLRTCTLENVCFDLANNEFLVAPDPLDNATAAAFAKGRPLAPVFYRNWGSSQPFLNLRAIPSLPDMALPTVVRLQKPVAITHLTYQTSGGAFWHRVFDGVGGALYMLYEAFGSKTNVSAAAGAGGDAGVSLSSIDPAWERAVTDNFVIHVPLADEVGPGLLGNVAPALSDHPLLHARHLRESGVELVCMNRAVVGRGEVSLGQWGDAPLGAMLAYRAALHRHFNVAVNASTQTHSERRRDVGFPGAARVLVPLRNSTRRLLNGDAVVARLRGLPGVASVLAVDMGSWPLQDQLQAFAQTDIVVGTHGANIGFAGLGMAPGGAVIEIFARHFYNDANRICTSRRMRHSYQEVRVDAAHSLPRLELLPGREGMDAALVDAILHHAAGGYPPPPVTPGDWLGFYRDQDVEVDVDAVATAVTAAITGLGRGWQGEQ